MKKFLSIFLLFFAAEKLVAQEPTLEWVEQMGGNLSDAAWDVDVDMYGDVFITGYFEGTADFDPSLTTSSLISTSGWRGAFIAKYDVDGNFLWAKQFTSTEGVEGVSIAVDKDGNVIATGFFNLTVDFDPGPGTTNLVSNGWDDIFIVKLDTDGNFMWAHNLGGPNGDQGFEVDTDTSGNVYVTGYFQNTVDFDLGPGTLNYSALGATDVFVCKLDAAGNSIWAKQFGGPSTDHDTAWGLTVDLSGNVITTGYFNNTVDFDPGTGTYNLTGIGALDGFVSKLDTDGNFVWAKQFGGPVAQTDGFSIVADSIGNVYSTGAFYGEVDFNPDAVGTDVFYSWTQFSTYISKLDKNGNYLWTKVFERLGGSNGSSGLSIALDGDNGVYTTGYFDGVQDFDPNAGTHNLTSIGTDIDAYISKLDTLGNFCWVKHLGGSGWGEGRGIAINQLGNIYTAGVFGNSIDFLSGLGTYQLSSGLYGDVFLHKMGECPTLDVTTNFNGTLMSANNPYYGFQWVDCNNGYTAIPGATGQNYIPTVAGSYAVILKWDICSDTSDCVSTSIGFDENSTSEITNISPNPTNGIFSVDFLSASSIKIYNTSGQLVFEEMMNEGIKKFDLQFLPDGIYFIDIVDQLEKKSIKLVIAH